VLISIVEVLSLLNQLYTLPSLSLSVHPRYIVLLHLIIATSLAPCRAITGTTILIFHSELNTYDTDSAIYHQLYHRQHNIVLQSTTDYNILRLFILVVLYFTLIIILIRFDMMIRRSNRINIFLSIFTRI
jgi:hypothetical protein